MRRNLLPQFLIVFLLLGFGVSAASAAVQNRITASVANSSPVAIPGSVHPNLKLATDLGAVPGNLKMQGMTLRFSMTDAQQAALDQLLIDQQNPASPQYHQWLTPAQYAAQFGLSSADIATVTAWLTSQGFAVTEVAQTASFVRFDGTAAQVNATFATSIHSLSLNGENHFANVSEVSVPSAFAGVVMAVTGLHDFRPKPRLRKAVVGDAVHAEYTSNLPGSTAHYMVPGDFYKIYDELPLFTASTPITGTGQTIAVMGQVDLYNGTGTNPSFTDIATFRSSAGLSISLPTVLTEGTHDPGGPQCQENCTPSDGDLEESSLDVEWAGAVAPGASILFVNGVDVFLTSLTDAIDNNVAPIVSISYGGCEALLGTTELNSLNQILKAGNAMGITIVAPTGDSGAADCDGPPSATQGLAVSFPASSPYVTATGGTSFNEGSSNYWSASNTTISAGTAVPGASVSALSYIPETTWDDAQYNTASAVYFGGGGGGVSIFFPKPYWQVGTGIVDASRDVPDISLDASDLHDGYLVCVQGSCTNGFSETIADGYIFGGTSLATPTFAGILALVEQKTGSRIGNANPTIYALANNSKYFVQGANFLTNNSVVFNDVTTGNNQVACSAGTYNCYGSTIGYSAGAGYDLVTGWGSINAANLVNDWSAVTAIGVSGPAGTNVSSTVVSVSAASVAANSSVTLTATVTGTAGPTPTGTIQFLVNNGIVGSGTLNGSGMATYSWTTSCSTLGQQLISASYLGDGTYLGSKGAGIVPTTNINSVVTPVTVQVTSGTCASFTLSGPTSTVSVASTTTPTATITATSTNGFTGTVVFTASAVSNTAYLPGLSFSPSSVMLAAGASQTTTLTLTGITADLRMPAAPGTHDPGTMLARHTPSRAPWYAAGSGATIASLLLLTLPRRRRLGALLLAALSIAIVGGASGCGGANSSISAKASDQYAGTYIVTVVGTYTNGSTVISQSLPAITFIIQ